MFDVNSINSFYLDVFKEIGNIGAGNAATSLSKLINRKVGMEVPRVKALNFCEVPEIMGGAEKEVIGVYVEICEDIQGCMLLVMTQHSARTLLKELMAFNHIDDHGFTEFQLSALEEITNILLGAYLSAIGTLTDLRIKYSVPCLTIDMAGAILSVPAVQIGQTGDKVLFIETDLVFKNNSIKVYIFLIPDYRSFDLMLESLGVE
ncbi:MAG: chemotaxis protein CheC [Mahellales bacterium]|jgi:chemotaxis protein CheC